MNTGKTEPKALRFVGYEDFFIYLSFLKNVSFELSKDNLKYEVKVNLIDSSGSMDFCINNQSNYFFSLRSGEKSPEILLGSCFKSKKRVEENSGSLVDQVYLLLSDLEAKRRVIDDPQLAEPLCAFFLALKKTVRDFSARKPSFSKLKEKIDKRGWDEGVIRFNGLSLATIGNEENDGFCLVEVERDVDDERISVFSEIEASFEDLYTLTVKLAFYYPSGESHLALPKLNTFLAIQEHSDVPAYQKFLVTQWLVRSAFFTDDILDENAVFLGIDNRFIVNEVETTSEWF